MGLFKLVHSCREFSKIKTFHFEEKEKHNTFSNHLRSKKTYSLTLRSIVIK